MQLNPGQTKKLEVKFSLNHTLQKNVSLSDEVYDIVTINVYKPSNGIVVTTDDDTMTFEAVDRSKTDETFVYDPESQILTIYSGEYDDENSLLIF